MQNSSLPLHGASLTAFQTIAYRNIVSLHTSTNLFDDIAPNPKAASVAQWVEISTKPSHYKSNVPIIDRPFEHALWESVIQWPFKHWQQSRFSDGSFGVWYGSHAAETTVFETVHHWVHGFLADAGFVRDGVCVERKIYDVHLQGLLVDLRVQKSLRSTLVHPTDYSGCQLIGKALADAQMQGAATWSARQAHATNFALTKPNSLSQPHLNCQVSYCIEGTHVQVHKQPSTRWLSVPI
jgi:hypothetical protein